MIKCIIQISDVHIRCKLRHEEYAEQFEKLLESIREKAKGFTRDEIRIVICGDLLHQKNTVTPELMGFASAFIRQLEMISNVLVIAGNHDLIVNNTSRKDTITSLFETAAFEHTFFVDYELDFKSGFLVDENITWVLYSIYDNYNKPQVDNIEGNTVIGLFHGPIIGSTFYNGTVVDNGIDNNHFNDCKYVLAGDIHKRQVIRRGDTEIVYSGSLIQQTFGESITQHGYCLWNLEGNTHEFIDIENDHPLFDIEIKAFDDIENDLEEIKNL